MTMEVNSSETTAIAQAKQQFALCFGLLALSVQDLTDEQYNWQPEGTCNPIAKTDAHASLALDFYVNGAMRNEPLIWPTIATAQDLPTDMASLWGYKQPIPQKLIRDYSDKVQGAVFSYLESIRDSDLIREVDSRLWGKRPIGFLLQMISSHTAFHAGEISTLKGIQGLKGQPF